MASPPLPPAAEASCMDCRAAPSTVTLRKRELCENCALRFISGKILRRMDRYKLRNAPRTHRRRLLLPLSFGVGSMTLLHVLDAHLRKHAVGGARVTPFDLVVLSVQPETVGGGTSVSGEQTPGDYDEERQRERMRRVQAAYPWITEYMSARLEDVFDIDEDILSVLRSHGWVAPEREGEAAGAGAGARDPAHLLRDFRTRLATPTTRRDMEQVLLARLVGAAARRAGCEGVFWGACDTTLAARALAHVAKGRGAALACEINDGPCPCPCPPDSSPGGREPINRNLYL
ncbi:cytoplasmic tRNA 2-thiolation protein 2 [Ascosphaera acerosa]|nr:cytoplasmic tRNA 2-thiolation protein 2 [Ascosphaera acerosa]